MLDFPVPMWNEHFTVMLLSLCVPAIILKYSKYLTLTHFGLKCKRPKWCRQGYQVWSTSARKNGLMPTLGQGLSAPGIELECNMFSFFCNMFKEGFFLIVEKYGSWQNNSYKKGSLCSSVLEMSENCIFQVINPVIRTNTCFEGLIKDIPNVRMILQCDSVGKLGEKSHKRRKQVIIQAGIDLIGVLNTIWMSSCGQRVQAPLKNWLHTAWAVSMGTFRDVLTDSASLPLPSALAQWICTSGWKVMHDSDDEQNAVSWCGGRVTVGSE